jgi:hypothetical protein
VKFVIVTTVYRGVFVGYTDDTKEDILFLRQARMILFWGTDYSLFQLANTGPTERTKCSDIADIEVHDISSVIHVTEIAESAWKSYKHG